MRIKINDFIYLNNFDIMVPLGSTRDWGLFKSYILYGSTITITNTGTISFGNVSYAYWQLTYKNTTPFDKQYTVYGTDIILEE